MTFQLDRRALLRASAAGSLAALSQPFTGVPALAGYAVAPALRRNAFTMAANDPILVGYRAAIAKMKALPDDNPCSWIYQASIHGSPSGALHPAWSTCEHGATYFWSWHRMYLYWFERIIRKYSGMYDWAIPYWDWTNPAQLQLPPQFRVSTNNLYDASRNSAMNSGAGSLSSTTPSAIASGLALFDFFSASGSISGTHGVIHGAVGGNMHSVSTAARDPIFFAHHSQVDRLWNVWLAQGGGRTDPLTDSAWKATAFTFFDECCQQVTMTGCEVLRAAEQLSYAYEEEPPQVKQYCLKFVIPWIELQLISILALPQPLALGKDAVTIPLTPREDKEISERLADIARAPSQNVVLVLKDVEAETPPEAAWEVYVGPAGAARGAESPYLVGVVSLFGQGIRSESGHKGHHEPARFVFPLDKAIAAGGAENLQVTFVPTSGVEVKGRPLPPKVRANVTIREISLAVDQAQAQPQPPTRKPR